MALTAGNILTQAYIDNLISGFTRQLNVLKFQVASTKAQMDGLGSAGVLAQPVGQRVSGVAMTTTDADNLLSALTDMNTALQGWAVVFAARVWGSGF